MVHRLLTLAVATLLTTPAGAQSVADTLRLARLSGPVVLDGMPDEPAWDAVAPLPMTMYTPHYGGTLTERTDIRVAYDDAHLYVGGRLYDADPAGVRTNTLYRDQYSGDDLLAIVLDTYNDNETASWFVVNPSGNRTDRSVSNDAEFTSGMPMNPEWNAFWDVVTRQTDEGWFAEMRIPFSSLGFQDADGRVLMGMIVYRLIARKNERQLFPAIPPDWPLGFAKPSQAQRILIDGVRSQRPVYVTPYVLGGVRRSGALDGSGAAYVFADTLTREAGLDVRYSPTSNLTLDLTANTDFAQVEADDQQVNLTRFSLFFPEKRQFFQERSAIFEFNTGGPSRLFHSRRIGLVEGEPIRLLGGARLVGRVGKTDVGLLDLQTAAERGLPAENFGVLRLRRQILNPYSTVGAMVTSRVAQDTGYNVTAGVDAVLRPLGDEYVTLKWAQVLRSGARATLGDLAATRMLARWERRNQRGLSYSAEVVRSGDAYEPGVGFALRRDFTFVENGLKYQWFPPPRLPFRTVSVEHRGQAYLRNGDRTVETAALEPAIMAELRGGTELTVTVRNRYESVRDSFELAGGMPVPPGDYWFHALELRHQASRAASFRPTVTASAGSFFDGSRISVSAAPAWNPSRHLELGVQYQFDALRFPERNAALDVHVVRVRVQAALDVHLSLATFVQYNSTTDDASVNARLRHNFREGRDLWIVYNETLNTDRTAPAGPALPISQRRALMLKYSHTLVW